MLARRSVLRIAMLAPLALGLARASSARPDGSFVVIVHPDNGITAVDRDFLRDGYLRKATQWSNGETIRPVDLTSRFPARDRFIESILHKTPAQLKTYWNQQIFSGKGTPPPEVDSVDDVIGYVLGHKGAVGYIPAGSDAGKAKIVRIR